MADKAVTTSISHAAMAYMLGITESLLNEDPVMGCLKAEAWRYTDEAGIGWYCHGGEAPALHLSRAVINIQTIDWESDGC